MSRVSLGYASCVIIPLLVLGCSPSTGHDAKPFATDAELITRFRRDRAILDSLVAIDRKKGWMAESLGTDWSRAGGRLAAQYRRFADERDRLLRAAALPGGELLSTRIYIPVRWVSVGGMEESKGYCFSESAPLEVASSLDGIPLRARLRSPIHRPLGGSWYLYRSSEVSD